MDCRDDRYRRGKVDGVPQSEIASPTVEPSLKTMSDFPRPRGVFDDNSSGGDLSDEDAGGKRTCVVLYSLQQEQGAMILAQNA